MSETTLSAISKMRLMDEMLGRVKVEDEWAVLLMDNVTTRIMTNLCGVADLLGYGVTLVDNVTLPRQPAPHLTGIYFITPTEASIRALVSDFTRRGQPQHNKVHVYFSSTVDPNLLQPIRGCSKLVERLVTMKEVNLEYILYPDNRSFITAQDDALPSLFGANVDTTDDPYRDQIQVMATRIATVFASLKEYPSIRFRAALPPGEEYPPGLEARLLVAQRLAVELYHTLAEMQRTGVIPERETCDLIITDRGFDPVAPVIHEWTYEAMTHDLLEGTPALKGKVYTYNSESQGGKKEPKDHILDERDAMHLQLRHLHFAAASLRISNAMDDIKTKSKIGGRVGLGQLDLKAMSKIVQALPEYRDQLAQLGAHVELASALNRAVDSRRLTELGKIEQDLVYGDATSKEVIAFLSANQMLPEEDKVRVLMCYSATHQEKLDPTRASQWQKVARLSSGNMSAITNLEYLGIPVCKRQKNGALASALTFGRRRRRTLRKDRDLNEDDSQYALSRFVPMLAEMLEDATNGRLSQEEYPYVRPPGSPRSSGGLSGGMASMSLNDSQADSDGTPRSGVTSFRTLRSTGNWAKKAGTSNAAAAGGAGGGDGGSNSNSRERVVEVGGGRGSRVMAFIIGGFTFSELRVAHRFAAKSGRDVILGGTAVQTPMNFIKQVMSLGEAGPSTPTAFEIEQPAKGGVSVRKKR